MAGEAKAEVSHLVLWKPGTSSLGPEISGSLFCWNGQLSSINKGCRWHLWEQVALRPPWHIQSLIEHRNNLTWKVKKGFLPRGFVHLAAGLVRNLQAGTERKGERNSVEAIQSNWAVLSE